MLLGWSMEMVLKAVASRLRCQPEYMRMYPPRHSMTFAGSIDGPQPNLNKDYKGIREEEKTPLMLVALSRG